MFMLGKLRAEPDGYRKSSDIGLTMSPWPSGVIVVDDPLRLTTANAVAGLVAVVRVNPYLNAPNDESVRNTSK